MSPTEISLEDANVICKECETHSETTKIVYFGKIRVNPIKALVEPLSDVNIDSKIHLAKQLYELYEAKWKYTTGPTLDDPLAQWGWLEWKLEVKNGNIVGAIPAAIPNALEIHQTCHICGRQHTVIGKI